MKKIYSLLFTFIVGFILCTQSMQAQVAESFDNSFCNDTTKCWEGTRGASVAGRLLREFNPAYSICNQQYFTHNTTNPISGTGSINAEFIYEYGALSGYEATLHSTAYGNDGDSVRFDIRFNRLYFDTANYELKVRIICGSDTAVFPFIPADSSVVHNISHIITGSNGGGTIRLGIYSYSEAFTDTLYVNADIDNFFTTAPYDSTNSCITPVILPLDLISFTGVGRNCADVLQWTTAEESNVRHFEIQRSTDARVFETIATVNAQNQASNHYRYTANTTNGNTKVSYYRLRMVDIDGTYRFSPNISIRGGCSNEAKIMIFPNPASDNVNISGMEQPCTIRIYDLAGRQVSHFIATQSKEVLDISGYANGSYLLQVLDKSGNLILNTKFVKSR